MLFFSFSHLDSSQQRSWASSRIHRLGDKQQVGNKPEEEQKKTLGSGMERGEGRARTTEAVGQMQWVRLVWGPLIS